MNESEYSSFPKKLKCITQSLIDLKYAFFRGLRGFA